MHLFIQEAAESDILHQVEWYAQQGVADVAQRFYTSTLTSMDALLIMPLAGIVKPSANARLADLRAWPVKDFDMFRIYYLVSTERLTIARILHGKMDIGAILDEQK